MRDFFNKLYLADTGIEWLDDLIEKVYDIYRSIRRFRDRVKLFFFWGNKLNNTYDFDCHDVYYMLHLKLERAYNCFKDHGHCVWNSSEKTNLMKKLKEAKELSLRLWQDDMQYRAHREADEKFKHKYWTEPLDNSMYKFRYTYEISPERAQLFINDRSRIYLAENKYRKKRLFYLLDKYLSYFWD